jgi:bacteriorhodopsin
MADVQMNQTDRGGASWVWAVVVVLLIAVIAWFVFMRGGAVTEDRTGVDVNITAPAPGGDGGGGGTAPPPGN